MIVAGRVSALVLLLVIMAIILGYMWRGLKGFMPKLRRLPAIDILEEIAGRCAEMGRPLWFLTGDGQLERPMDMPITLASFAALEYVAHLTAKYNVKFHVPTVLYTAYPIQHDIVRTAYIAEGKGELFDPLYTVMYVASGPHRLYVVDGMFRERVAGNIMIGSYYHTAIIFAEAAARAGALQLGGTDTTHNIPFFVGACDYFLIGEENYALGAYLTKEPIMTASIVGQDWGKIIAGAIIIVGVILLLAGVDVRAWLRM